MVRVRAKIEKNTLFGIALVRDRAEIEKNTFFGRDFGTEKEQPFRALVRSEIEKSTHFGSFGRNK